MAVNVELLKKIRGFIADPKTVPYFEMSTWADFCWVKENARGMVAAGEKGGRGYRKTKEGLNPPCGSTLCVAGLAALAAAPVGSVIYDGDILFPDNHAEMCDIYAAEVLGLEKSIAALLFYAPNGAVLPMLDYLIAHPRRAYETLRRIRLSYQHDSE